VENLAFGMPRLTHVMWAMLRFFRNPNAYARKLNWTPKPMFHLMRAFLLLAGVTLVVQGDCWANEPSSPRAPKAGDVIKNSIGMQLAFIPQGKFLMGSPASEPDRGEDEFQHEVQITRPFYLGVYEVTQAEYQQVMRASPSHFNRKQVGQDTSRFPVEDVSWKDATEFCRRLSELPGERAAGRVYRLPTEAEWEYACRAGTQTATSFGDRLDSTQANFDGTHPYNRAAKGPELERTTAVGSYRPNAWGLYDMHGNAQEWCQDWYDEKYYKASPGSDPEGPATKTERRVVRGGGWWWSGENCRSARRLSWWPDKSDYMSGIRVAVTARD
jgi:formylglycine-generating enzyme required for sulfatase activity